MKTLEDLKQFYTNELSADLQDLEESRKINAKKYLLILFIFLAPVLIILHFIFAAIAFNARIYFYGVIGITCVIFYYAFQFVNKDYKNNFKHLIIEKIINFIDHSLQYFPDRKIVEKHFFNSFLFDTENLVTYFGDDLVIGTIGKTKIRFCDIHANYDPSYHQFQQSNRDLHFYGLLFIADFNKHFKNITLVSPKKARLKKLLYKPSIFQNDKKLKLVKIDHIEFENSFNIYSNDDIEVRYLLTPNLMQKILNFQQKTRTKIALSFVDSNVHIAIPRHGDSFEPKYFSSIVNFESIKNYFEDLELAISIVEELNLNTRIWTKE